MNEVLNAAGPQAAHIAALWQFTYWVCVGVFVAVMAALAWAIVQGVRRRSAIESAGPDLHSAASGDRRSGIAIGAGIAVSSLLLIVLLVASVMTDRALAQLPLANALEVRVIAHQWWWEVVYEDREPARVFATANELVIPVGRPVAVTLQADDVIHSFWVPELHGKKDLIPGRDATIRFRADREGTFTGRCAEFCGVQHAFMSYDVVALSPERFAEWAAHQREPAPEPRDPEAIRGRELFLTGSCMLCHAIQGTTASGRRAPDLTHIASRAHLGAGRLVNTPQALAAWIADPHKFKPGVNMPPHLLPGADLGALVAYLGTLR
jgi:cytochrome c oxidase subunit 2